MDNFDNTNLGKMIARLKHYYLAHPQKVKMQVLIVFLLVTIASGRAGQSIAVFTGAIEKTSWNPIYILYYAWIKMFLVSAALLLIINFIIIYIKINMDDKYYDKDRNFQISEKGTMGTGGFMQTDDKEKALILDDVENINGTILGRDPDTKLVCSPRKTLYLNGHKVVCGGSGARKTTTQVMNELFQIIKREESFIVTDPKGEIYEMLAVMCEEEGYTTKVMNLVNLQNSDGVDFVKCCMDKNGNQDREIQNAQTLAKVIMSNTAENITGGFWDDNQRGLLTAAVLYVMYDKTGRTEPTLAGAYEFLLNNDKTELDGLFTHLDKSHPARAEYLIYAKTEAKVRDSVINGLMMRLQIFQTHSTKRIVSSDEIDLTLPSKQKCAYFLVMSDQVSTFDFIASLFFSMFFIKEVQYVDSLKKSVRESKACIPVNLVMDEFPSIGTIPDFDKKLATLRSRKIFIEIIFQNYGQIIDKYEKNQWETIVSNCDINIYLGGNDSEKTAEYYSNRLGEMTVVTKGKRIQEKLLSATDNRFHPSYMTTESESSRPVMTKDELLRLDTDHAIVFMKSCRPLDVLKFVYTEHPYSQRIVERNPTIHIPEWRRKEEGYPDLTDNELEPILEKMHEDGTIRDYLEMHSNNRKYMFMDYLYEHDLDEFEKCYNILMKRTGEPVETEAQSFEQTFRESKDGAKEGFRKESAGEETYPDTNKGNVENRPAASMGTGDTSGKADAANTSGASYKEQPEERQDKKQTTGGAKQFDPSVLKDKVSGTLPDPANQKSQNTNQEKNTSQDENPSSDSTGTQGYAGRSYGASSYVPPETKKPPRRFKATTPQKFEEDEKRRQEHLEEIQRQDKMKNQPPAAAAPEDQVKEEPKGTQDKTNGPAADTGIGDAKATEADTSVTDETKEKLLDNSDNCNGESNNNVSCETLSNENKGSKSEVESHTAALEIQLTSKEDESTETLQGVLNELSDIGIDDKSGIADDLLKEASKEIAKETPEATTEAIKERLMVKQEDGKPEEIESAANDSKEREKASDEKGMASTQKTPNKGIPVKDASKEANNADKADKAGIYDDEPDFDPSDVSFALPEAKGKEMPEEDIPYDVAADTFIDEGISEERKEADSQEMHENGIGETIMEEVANETETIPQPDDILYQEEAIYDAPSSSGQGRTHGQLISEQTETPVPEMAEGTLQESIHAADMTDMEAGKEACPAASEEKNEASEADGKPQMTEKPDKQEAKTKELRKDDFQLFNDSGETQFTAGTQTGMPSIGMKRNADRKRRGVKRIDKPDF